MFNVSLNRMMRVTRLGALAMAALLACTSAVFAQATGTATVRGTVTDSSGGVLPGATVTVTNAGTKAVVTAVTDDRGGYLAVLFPGTYELKVELSGFKTYEQKGIVISPDLTRGIDVKLEVGQQSETITVTAQQEVIQTETGAREGVLSAKQIDNLSVIGRSALELLRIMPGVVAPDPINMESVSFGGGANNTAGYTVNGIRGSTNTVSLDGSNLIDIGSNSGVIVTLNNDMVQEVKVQSSNFAAEYGSGAMNVSAVTKAGTSQFHGTLYDYSRNYRFAANDRSNSIAGVDKPHSTFQYPGGNVGGPIILPGTDFNKNRDKLFFFAGIEVQRQQVDSGSRFGVVPTLAQRNGDFSEFLTTNGQNLNQQIGCFNTAAGGGIKNQGEAPSACLSSGGFPGLIIPRGFPGAGGMVPGANLNNVPGLVAPLGKVLANLYPAPNYSVANNQFNYVYSTLDPTNRLEMKYRFDWNITNNTKAYVRVAHDNETANGARGVWWGASDVALPSPNVGTNHGRSYSGNVVSVLSPTTTNEALVSWSRLTLDNTYEDPSVMRLDTYGLSLPGSFGNQSPYIPGIIPNWGGGVSNMWSAANDMYAHNDELLFSDKLTKIMGAHGLKFGANLDRLQKQQNFQNNEEGQLIFAPAWTSGGQTTGNAVGDIMSGYVTQYGSGTRGPDGQFRFWNMDFFAQDSWKLRPNLTLEYGVRGGYWTNNQELNGLGGWFNPTLYDPKQGEFLDPPAFTKLNGVCYVSSGCAPSGILDNRSPFVMPRVNLAWDIDGEGKNVLRGGYGIFVNRNMGNVEYDQSLHLIPAAYALTTGAGDGFNYTSNGVPVGLRYDTLDQATLATRIGASSINTLTPNSFTFPKTASYSVSYARRIMWNQVVEASYVGTHGYDLVSRVNANAVPFGGMDSTTLGGVDMSNPVNRWNVNSSLLNQLRPYPTIPGLTQYDFSGISWYNSLQVTLSRQTGRRLQYFMAYTYGQEKGTLGDEYRNRDPFNEASTYGIRDTDRSHILNVSFNAFLPDGAKGGMDNAFGRGLLNGWQLSGIYTFTSGTPLRLNLGGAATGAQVAQAYFGTPDTVLIDQGGGNFHTGLAPTYTCDPRTGATGVGEKLLDLNCIGIPAFGQQGQVIAPYNLRTPSRSNTDLTLFKNFPIHGEQKLQFRVGFFDLFNTAYTTFSVSQNDVNLTLNAVCNVTVNHVPNGTGGFSDGVCDATQGFHFDQATIDNFGKINIKRGHRVVEFALKYYF
jgi:hypothetical protein